MNRKRNVSYIKPEDPEFLKILKKQAGYDDKNHKFDDLKNSEDDFVEDDDSEKPQVVVLKTGDLTAEEAELEIKNIEKKESESKADLTKKVIFQPKGTKPSSTNSKKRKDESVKTSQNKKPKPLLSFNDDELDEDDET